MQREWKDELEVPGHVVMIKPRTKSEIASEIRSILDQYEKLGLTKLKELPESAKKVLRENFDLLGIPHDDLNGGGN